MDKDTIMELIKKEVNVAETLLNIINEISIEYRSTGEIIIRLYRPKEDNKKVGDMINNIIDPLGSNSQFARSSNETRWNSFLKITKQKFQRSICEE